MTDSETREELIEEWHIWRARHVAVRHKATVADAIRFCAHLTRREYPVLNRCPGGDPWQYVRTVLLEAGAVSAIDPRAPLAAG